MKRFFQFLLRNRQYNDTRLHIMRLFVFNIQVNLMISYFGMLFMFHNLEIICTSVKMKGLLLKQAGIAETKLDENKIK